MGAPKSASVSSSSSAAPKTAAVAQSDPKKEAAQTLDAGSSKDAAVESPGPKKKKRRLELASPTQLKKNEEDASADTRPKEKAAVPAAHGQSCRMVWHIRPAGT